MFLAAFAGILAGSIHALSGPDHLAALAPLASEGQRRTWAAGAMWGLGHASGVLVVGMLALLFKDWLPIDLLSSWSERIVGIALVAIGLWGLRRALRTRVHTHEHVHEDKKVGHVHVHAHASAVPPAAARTAAHGGTAHSHTHAAFAVGILHGFAGSSHFLAVLPALALPGVAASLAYLTGYGVGTVGAMTVFASVLGFLAARARRTSPDATRWLLSGCSLAAVVVGVAWLR